MPSIFAASQEELFEEAVGGRHVDHVFVGPALDLPLGSPVAGQDGASVSPTVATLPPCGGRGERWPHLASHKKEARVRASWALWAPRGALGRRLVLGRQQANDLDQVRPPAGVGVAPGLDLIERVAGGVVVQNDHVHISALLGTFEKRDQLEFLGALR